MILIIRNTHLLPFRSLTNDDVTPQWCSAAGPRLAGDGCVVEAGYAAQRSRCACITTIMRSPLSILVAFASQAASLATSW